MIESELFIVIATGTFELRFQYSSVDWTFALKLCLSMLTCIVESEWRASGGQLQA